MTTTMKVTSKNQVTFPKKVLDALGVKKGDRLKVQIKGKKLIIEPEGMGFLEFIDKHNLKLNIPKDKDIDELIEEAKDEYYKEELSRY